MDRNLNEILKKALNDSKKVKILVIGDVILDEYIWGEVHRISPEAPVQVVKWCSENCSMGGASNVAANLAVLGCEVYLCGVIGADNNGKLLEKLLCEANINTDGLIIDDSRHTTSKIRIIAKNQQVLRVDKEVDDPISPGIGSKMISYISDMVPHVDGILCSDYNKGVLAPGFLEQVTQIARSHSKMIIADPKGKDYSKYVNTSVITPNLLEAELASGIKIKSEDDLKKCAFILLDQLNGQAILITRGKDGMSLFQRDKEVINIPTEAKSVFDVTGAGDTVLSYFGAIAFAGYPFHVAARLANIAAGIAVGKVGAATVSRHEVMDYMELGHRRLSKKIVTLKELKNIVSVRRNLDQTIVFTNGCFDLLHFGHIKYLRQANELGDILILGLNDDSSVKKIKGDQRPLIGEDQRAHILAALDCVDYVTIFSELNPLNIIKEIKPDTLVKGGDYSVDQVVGKEIVEGYGGKVVIVPLVKNVSTSSIVKNIVQKYSNGN